MGITEWKYGLLPLLGTSYVAILPNLTLISYYILVSISIFPGVGELNIIFVCSIKVDYVL